MIYASFAELYDKLMDPSIYEDWANFIMRLVPSKRQTILDLACGTGRLAVKLVQAGYAVSGVDLSPEMLSLAELNARMQKVTLPLIQADMTALDGLERFDVVVSCLDSLCYLQSPADLKKTFVQVREHLEDEGTFIFDVISPYQTDTVYPGYTYAHTTEQQAFTWESYAGEQAHSVIHDLNFFIKEQQTQQYRRVTEIHQERTYPVADYLKFLSEAGFARVAVFSDFGRQDVTATTTRYFFVCHKE
ncbi:class I SAM-dependent DNA methyltransferase [Liquorilactobacillus satsumensis]|uniref:class I SAM-dependent DNA methyltransferase n=1 Tax=Liquorilactobacillus satsumensis TaxID=259059 RepID=UPI001E31AE5F|nr:class I SAM-dependent methyltransferase [Liquorilactobacillus satsumensis]MCC7665663.1 SAM-dependent methyltransferase [Liquorilactobacillus satsumensis]MCP9356544.1 class I SAM-dependent methyltransferase [Liquorilactobacillus satsumensis]MCP9370317.1 class I SAM-dependent methyltransferase [Liquorilactobacillus satsumensis]